MKSGLLRAVAWVLLCAPLAAQDAASLSVEAREAGRYADALAFAARVEEPGTSALLTLLAHYWAGDLSGALAAGRRGLEQAPESMQLLYYSTLLPLDLAVPELAAEMLPRLNLVVHESTQLSADDRAAYMQLCEGLAERLGDQQAKDAQRSQAETRGKGLALLLGGAMVLATLGLLTLRPRPSA